MKILFGSRYKDLPFWLVILGVPFIYWLHNRVYTGPTFLSDEIGYLTNAAVLAGHQIDGASNFHAGYSLFLTPLFAVFTRPSVVWQGLLVINTVLWVFSFFILHRLLLILFPGSSNNQRFLALVFSIFYPSWLTMAGYAFASSAIVFVFMCSLITLSRWKTGHILSIVPHSLCVGFLYWVHPTGLGAAAASLALVAIVVWRSRNLRQLAVHISILLSMVIFYHLGLERWLFTSMTPKGYSPILQYADLPARFAEMASITWWVRWVMNIFGQFSYLIVGTLGLGVFGGILCIRFAWKMLRNHVGAENSARASMAFYLILTVLFVVVLSAAAEQIALLGVSVDSWIYGRYVDCVALPLMVVGFLGLKDIGLRLRLAYATASGIFVIFTGLLIDRFAEIGANNAILMTSAFWPQYLITKPNYFLWMLMGTAGILLVSLGRQYVALILILASLLLSAPRQAEFHKSVLAWWTRPSSLVEVVRANFQSRSCVAFDPAAINDPSSFFRSVRFDLYKFYLFNYTYRRMTSAEWLSGCDGPLLTTKVQQFVDDNRVKIVARENFSGLFLVIKANGHLPVIPPSVQNADDIYLAHSGRNACLLAGCFSMTASDLENFSLAGRMENGSLITDGRASALFYGPYYKLNAGKYDLILHGQFDSVPDAKIDIVKNGANDHIAESQLSLLATSGRSELIMPFSLTTDVSDFQVRLWVSSKDQLAVSGYEINLAQNQSLLSPKAGLSVYAEALMQLPRQVGIIDGNMISSNHQAGFLVYGPYVQLNAGQYHLVVHGLAPQASSAWVDVVSNLGTIQYLRLKISTLSDSPPGAIAEGFLTLNAPVDNIEVRVYAGEADVVHLMGYDLLPVDK